MLINFDVVYKKTYKCGLYVVAIALIRIPFTDRKNRFNIMNHFLY